MDITERNDDNKEIALPEGFGSDMSPEWQNIDIAGMGQSVAVGKAYDMGYQKAKAELSGYLSPEQVRERAIEDIFWCDKHTKCQWKCFALDYYGYAIGRIENTLLAWREAHEHYCGGNLIQGKIITESLKSESE
jgi:hypothetical protein